MQKQRTMKVHRGKVRLLTILLLEAVEGLRVGDDGGSAVGDVEGGAVEGDAVEGSGVGALVGTEWPKRKAAKPTPSLMLYVTYTQPSS